MSDRRLLVVCSCFAIACSSSNNDSSPASSDAAPIPSATDAGASAPREASGGGATLHGAMIDFESLEGVAGLTVTGAGSSATTDKSGLWTFQAPLGATVQTSVTNDSYSRVLFPDLIAVVADVDLGSIVIPDISTFQLEGEILPGFDGTKALVHIMISTLPTCASAVGGAVTVTSPSGASVAYFGSNPIPSASVTSFQQVAAGRPVAIVYNVDPGATLSVQISHPSCKQVPFPATFGGLQYPGTVPLQPATGEPSGVSSALVFVLE